MGSSSYITDKEGNIIQHTEYIAFGEVLVDEHSTSNKMPYLFNGKELDQETGLYYYGARYYDPKVSIFLNVDPLVEKTGTPYAYTYNNPINLIDPTGMEGEDPKPAANIGVKIGVGNGGLNFNLTVSLGLEYKTSNFQAVAFASASIYGGQQLGTSSKTVGTQYDLTVGVYASLGAGQGTSHSMYTLNYNTESPFNNTFDTSITYGQMLTYNSAINALGDGPGIQSQGLIGARFGNNFSFSSNNDANSYGSNLFYNKNTDAAWTGGIVFNVGGVEFGYQNFSGYWPEFGSSGTNYGYVFSAENRMGTGQNGGYHQSLNRAFNFIRMNGTTQGVYSDAWFQKAIHKHFSNDGTYKYNSIGKSNIMIGK